MPPTVRRNMRSASTRAQQLEGESRKRSSGSASLPTSCTTLPLADRIVQGLQDRADAKTKAWFTNYVKGTVWIGCKVPAVRATIDQVMGKKGGATKKLKTEASNAKAIHDASVIMDNAIQLLQHEACDAKLGGMLLLSEHYPPTMLASMATLDRFDQDIWQDHSIIGDWSTADWFSNKVLRNIVFIDSNKNKGGEQDTNSRKDRCYLLQKRVLDYTRQPQASLWQRRCGVVSFLHYHKHRSILPNDIGSLLIQACQDNLLASPEERFTQTGIAWVLRYVLIQDKQHADDSQAALDFICRHGSVWTMEAKKFNQQ